MKRAPQFLRLGQVMRKCLGGRTGRLYTKKWQGGLQHRHRADRGPNVCESPSYCNRNWRALSHDGARFIEPYGIKPKSRRIRRLTHGH